MLSHKFPNNYLAAAYWNERSGGIVPATSRKKLEKTLTNPFELRETKTKHEVINWADCQRSPGLMKRVGNENVLFKSN